MDDMQSLVLAAGGVVVCPFKKINILNAVVTLIASYYLFNADYPKDLGGHSKNVYLFLEYILMPELRSNRSLSINVKTIGKLNKMV